MKIEKKEGIVQIKKLVDLVSGTVNIACDIDWNKIPDEWADLDAEERAELIKLIGDKLIAILSKLQEYKFILQLILKLIK